MTRHPSDAHTHPARLLVLAAGFLLLAACGDVGEELPTGSTDLERSERVESPGLQDFGPAIRAADRHTPGLMRRDGVVGTAVGLNDAGRPVVKLFLAHGNVPDLPDQVDGVPVVREVTGLFHARAQETTDRARPAPVGYSVGHPDVTAGTLGARVEDGTDVYILSNNHVIANSNDANIGDPTLQPGAFDGGVEPEDVIGTLHDFEEISFNSNNVMDAAVSIVDGADVSGATPDGEAYGAPGTTVTEATIGMNVQKYGRTTGHTQGEVAEINVTVSVCYVTRGPFQCESAATFEDQFTVIDGSFSDGGDSGSLIVTDDGDNDPVGLLFAGGSDRTIANPIGPVLDRFGVEIDPTVPDDDGGDPDPDPNDPPTASFTFGCTELACDFDASGSSDSDGSIASYDWDFGDGNSGSGEAPSHTYGEDDTYTVELTVTDDDGATDTASQDVTVEAEDDPDPDPDPVDPTIDTFEVSTRTTGPWARADVTWSVSHESGALETVTTELLDSGGNPLDSQTSEVSGGNASGEHNLRTRDSPASVRITVESSDGRSATQTVAF